MYGPVIKYGTIVLIAGMVGWAINGWRLNASIASLRASYAEEKTQALAQVRSREKGLIEAADKLRKDRDAKIKDLNGRLSTALGELHNRQNRNSSDPTNTAACSGTTGAELSKEDAEFLVRFAAEADRAVENLNYCIAQYNKLPAK